MTKKHIHLTFSSRLNLEIVRCLVIILAIDVIHLVNVKERAGRIAHLAVDLASHWHFDRARTIQKSILRVGQLVCFVNAATTVVACVYREIGLFCVVDSLHVKLPQVAYEHATVPVLSIRLDEHEHEKSFGTQVVVDERVNVPVIFENILNNALLKLKNILCYLIE